MAEKDCCSRTAVPCSQSRCCRKESGGIRNRISCIFLLYSFIFSRNSPHCRQGVSGCHSGDPEVIFRQSARSPDMSPEEKEEAVKKFSFIFSLSRRPFSFAVKKASPPERRPSSSQFHTVSGPVPSDCASLQPEG